MPKLYRALRFLLRGAVELYYVRIESTGQELVPTQGPLIFAANHPNSIMDTVILGTQTPRLISYMARSGLFKNPLVAALFRSCGVIPLYRAQDNPALLHQNQSSFRSAYQKLGQGGCIGIFPEGKNSQERALYKIKTGTARIALGAEAAHDYQLGLKIVPVGLNFVNRDRFLSSVLVRFGQPIDVADFAQQHRAQERDAVRALTDHLQERLRQEATHIEGDLTQSLTLDVYKIYGSRLLEDLATRWDSQDSLSGRFLDEVRAARPGAAQGLDDVFVVKQRIADTIAWFQQHRPEVFNSLHNQILAYKDHLDQAQLRHDFMDRRPEVISRRRESIKFTLYALLLSPVAALGLLGNALPYLLTRALALRAPDEPIRAIRGLGIGMVLFPLFYTLEVGWLHLLGVNWWWTVACLLALPAAGFAYLRYRRQLSRYRHRILVRTLFLTDRAMIVRLAAERQRLLNLLDQARLLFLQESQGQVADPQEATP
jgi:1-acyl-sn-glycerol-3-phosphate acyltransferase